MPRLVEADNESQVSSTSHTAMSTVGSSRSSLTSGGGVVGQKTFAPPINRAFVSQPFTGRMTLDVIEEFLNPISNRSSSSSILDSSQSGLMSLPTATGGYGLTCTVKTSGCEDDEVDKRLERKRQQREEAERSYRSMRKEFEIELARAAINEMSLDENNVKKELP